MNRADRFLCTYALVASLIVAPAFAQSSGCTPSTTTVEIPQGTARVLVGWSAPGSITYVSSSWNCDGTHPTTTKTGGQWDFTVTAGGTTVSRSGTVMLFGYDAGGPNHPAQTKPPTLPAVTGTTFINVGSLTASGPLTVSITRHSCITTFEQLSGTSSSAPFNFLAGVAPSFLSLGISSDLPLIPDNATVRSGCVQYKALLTGNVYETQGNSGVSGVNIQFDSDRKTPTAVDTFVQPASASDSFGFVSGAVKTRKRGLATITGSGLDIDASRITTASIDFHEADYESAFDTTGYAMADENDAVFAGGAQVTNPPGLVGTFYHDFLYSNRGVRMEGTGMARDGRLITLDWNNCHPCNGPGNYVFMVDNCDHAANGRCLTVDVSCATDPNIIPMGPSPSSASPATINVVGVGTRIAEDTGKSISGRHIDLYMSDTHTANAWGHRSKAVRFISGGGSCD